MLAHSLKAVGGFSLVLGISPVLMAGMSCRHKQAHERGTATAEPKAQARAI